MPKAKLAWSENDYTPYTINLYGRHTVAEVRAEYTRIRDILHKRMMRMKAQNPDAPFVKNFDELFPRLRDLDWKMQDKTSRWQFSASKEQALAVLITEAAGAINAPGTSIRASNAQKREIAAKFREQGFTGVTSFNVTGLMDFFREIKKKYGRKAYDSETIIDMWYWASKRKLNPSIVMDAYNDFEGRREEFLRGFRVKGGHQNASSKSLRQKFDRYAEQIKNSKS